MHIKGPTCRRISCFHNDVRLEGFCVEQNDFQIVIELELVHQRRLEKNTKCDAMVCVQNVDSLLGVVKGSKIVENTCKIRETVRYAVNTLKCSENYSSINAFICIEGDFCKVYFIISYFDRHFCLMSHRK